MLFGFSGTTGFFSASQSGTLLSVNLKLKGAVPPNMVTRVTMLPERVVREIRRADPEYWAALAKAYSRSVDEGKPLGAAGVVAPVDVFSHSASFIER